LRKIYQSEILLEKLIEHNQVFEFIEVYSIYENEFLIEQDSNPGTCRLLNGQTFLHLAVKYNSLQILAYLLIDKQSNPNMLNNLPNHDVLAEVGGQHHNTDLFDMSILH